MEEKDFTQASTNIHLKQKVYMTRSLGTQSSGIQCPCRKSEPWLIYNE